MKRFSIQFAILAATTAAWLAPADDVVFHNGRVIEDAEVVSIEDGQITISYGESPQEAKTALANVAAIRPAAAGFRISKFVEHQEGRDTGRLIEIETLTNRQRLREPLVRVFVIMQDERGARELHVFQNHRVKDPTALYDLPVVSSKAWSPARFFVEVDHKAVAWHVEIWQDGKLAFDRDLGRRELRRKWWLLQEPDRNSRLDVPEDAEEALGETAGVRAVIRNARPRRGLDNEQAQVECEWALETDKERIALPEATFYYVTENQDGERKVHKEKVAKDAGKEVKVQARKVVRTEVVELDKDVVLAGGGTSLVGNDDEEAKRLIYWRFAVHVGDVDLAVRESPNTDVRRSLGANWWRQ